MPILTKPGKALDKGHFETSLHLIDRYNSMRWSTDYPSIQAAVDAASATQSRVFIPAGVYEIDETINILWGVTLEGEGKFSSILKASAGFVGPMLRVYNDNYTGYTRIIGLGLDGNHAAQHGIEWSKTQDNLIDNVQISSCLEHGIYMIGDVWDSSIRDSLIKDNGSNGICADSAGKQNNMITIQSTKIIDNQGAGIRLINTMQTRIISGCVIADNGLGGQEQFGLYASGGGIKLDICGNYFEQNGVQQQGKGIDVRVCGDLITPRYIPSIRENYFFGGRDAVKQPGTNAYAVELENTSGATIINNFMWLCVSGSIHYVGKNVDPVEQSNFLGDPIVTDA